MTPYRVGVSGAAVDNQRWRWERVASSATAGITWRIKNVASGLCLDKNSSNAVVISACGTATSQRWRAPLDDPFGGWTLVNGANSQCLQVVGSSTANGALLQTAACSGIASQAWRLRSAPLDCTIRSRDWTMTEVCASQSAERMIGVTANWRHYPITMSWLDPELYILTHTTNVYTQVRPLKPDFSQGATGVELGSRAQRSTQQTGTVSYWAYWLEWNASTEQYHALTTSQAPRSDTADGRNHTYMLLGKGNAGQWDVLYDYNTVATSALQAGGSTRSSRSGMAVRYPQATTTATPFDLRMQLMDGNGVWRRPYLGETGTGEPKTCETPPRYEDWIYDTVNMPPNCFAAAYATRAGATATDPVQTDAFTVGKPATSTALTTAAAPAPATGPQTLTAAGVHHGVDQQALAACLDNAARNCIEEVPGLGACVAARAICNVTGRVSAGKPASTPMTAQEAVKAATGTFAVVGPARTATVTTQRQPDARLTADAPVDGPVHVVRSTARVRSLAASHDKVYDGYTAVFEAASGRMISACLGTGCREAS
ncbi:RICIN domain-containing protein [Actinoplanes sp. NPDC049118]|uniref:RICIN domain-containing protein n=1 Tax=Actinoplanes sp. NPDC049118 TaxID=3155769 RepID=UPI0033DCF02F